MKSKVVALSAISASFVAISLTFGAYIELIDLVSLVLSSVFVVLPLYYKSYAGSFLAYLVGGIIAFMISGFNIMSVVFPAYFAFFGIFPVIKNLLAMKGFNKKLSFVIGLVWCVAVFFGIYFYYTAVMGQFFTDLPQWLNDHILYVVGLVGVAFYIVFDRFVFVTRYVIDRYLQRIIK